MSVHAELDYYRIDTLKVMVTAMILKVFIVIAAVCGILLQCGVADGQFSFETFRMFTTLSNLAVAVYFAWHVVAALRGSSGAGDDKRVPGKGRGRRAAEVPSYMYKWKFMVMMGILLTGLVAHFMLRGMFDSLPSAERFGITLLHYVVPIAVLLDWILCDERGMVRAWMPPFAALFPVIYGAASMTIVGITGSGNYPYPFLNVDELGLGTVLLVMAGLAAGFMIVGYILYFLDRLAARRKS